jgi:hypothetical protein
MSSYTLTSAPRSTVTHVHDLSTTLGHLTACGRRIGDNWSGEYDEGLPDGMPTCKGCLRHLDKSVARPFRCVCTDKDGHGHTCAGYPAGSRVGDVPAGHVPVGGSWAGTYEPLPAVSATFAAGQRVGILTGFLSVSGPWVKSYGTVIGSFDGWTGVEMWTVRGNDESEPGVYETWMLRALELDAIASDEVVENVTPLDDDGVCPCSAYPDPHPVHCEECSARQDECVCADEATEWRNLRGVRVATARRHLRDATLYRQHGARDEWALSMSRAATARRNGWHASILLGQVES